MRVADLDLEELKYILKTSGLLLQTGRFTTKVVCSIEAVAIDIVTLYGNTCLLKDAFYDFSIELRGSSGPRRWLRPQVDFFFNGVQPFTPLPLEQATPLLEWGLNWCVSNHYHQKLLVHAAALEKNGRALILPGQPGAGKSTLCAALVLKGGYRLLSDELTVIDLSNGEVSPNPRPISLKNKAIEVIRELSPQTLCTKTVQDTMKGAVSLFRAPQDSVQRVNETARPGLVLFPKFNSSASTLNLQTVAKCHAFIELANQSFNYPILGALGFNAIAKHLDSASCFNLEYDGDLSVAIELVDELMLNE